MDRNGLGGIRSGGGEVSGRSGFKGVEIGSLRHRPLSLPSGPFGDRRRSRNPRDDNRRRENGQFVKRSAAGGEAVSVNVTGETSR